MIPTNSVVKITAKSALTNKWVKAIFASCILIFISFVLLNATSVLSLVLGELGAGIFFNLLVVFMISPIVLGLIRYFWRFLFEVEDNPIAVFYYFLNISVYKRALSLILNLLFKTVLFGVLINLPKFILILMSKGFVYKFIGMPIPVWSVGLSNVSVIYGVISAVVLFFILSRYYIAPVIFIADDNIDAQEAMHMSTIISKKSSMDFYYLILSFIGWFLLCLTVVPVIFVVPYFIVSYLVHVRFAIAEYNKHIEDMSKKIFPSITV